MAVEINLIHRNNTEASKMRRERNISQMKEKNSMKEINKMEASQVKKAASLWKCVILAIVNMRSHKNKNSVCGCRQSSAWVQ